MSKYLKAIHLKQSMFLSKEFAVLSPVLSPMNLLIHRRLLMRGLFGIKIIKEKQ